MEDSYKRSVPFAVDTLLRLAKNEKNDLWVKSKEDDGRDVLVQHKYQQAFPWWSNNKNNPSSSWTTEASRASAFVQMDHLDLADTLANHDWSEWFPNMVAKEKIIKVLSPGSSEDNPHGTLHKVYKEMQATSPMVANRKLSLLRSCTQIDQATWVIAEISFVCPTSNTYRRLPSGCLIEGITEDLSKVTWVEHTEVIHESLQSQTLFYDHLIRSGFAFGAERMVAWLERSFERWAHKSFVNDMVHETPGQEVPWILEKLTLMEFGDIMVSGLFQNVSPNDDCNSILWRSVTGSEDLKVYASLYKSSANFEVAAGVVAFSVRHSPEFVLKTLGDERTHHEWDVLGGLTKLNTFRKYLTGVDIRNNISAFMISSNEMLIKEVNVNRSGSLVLWSTVSMKAFDLISRGKRFSEDPVLISGFSITTNGHTSASNAGGSVITLVLRMLVQQPLQEQRQQAIESITLAINQTVGRVKEALEKPQPPPSRGDWPTEKQQFGVDDIASDQIMQDMLGILKLVN